MPDEIGTNLVHTEGKCQQHCEYIEECLATTIYIRQTKAIIERIKEHVALYRQVNKQL